VFNSDKTKYLIFDPKKITLRLPVITLKITRLKVVKDVKYLGFHIDSHLRDDIDIRRQTRALYCVANKLRFKYFLLFETGGKHSISFVLHAYVWVPIMMYILLLSYVYRSAKFDAKFINFFARLFILFYHSPIYKTFRTETKIK